MGGRTDFAKILRAPPFYEMKAFGFIPLSARSILLYSAFKVTLERDDFTQLF